MANRKRVIWRCRRGMKELDVILEPFAAAGLPGIEDDVLDDFEALLESADADLLAWFMGASRPFEPGWQKLVDTVVDHSRAHLSAV